MNPDGLQDLLRSVQRGEVLLWDDFGAARIASQINHL